ncbi:hypothetical protein NFJ59_08895 [Citrobacter freundii]|uniref:CDI toxin immunity protein n=1 Tax=Citrobacter TaxID=544 RepID=UPI000E3D1822|nr:MULTISPECIES: hypothetical protein [Citrobacter]MBA8563879.1 hypothetical protein [Citrobacter freundii]MBD0830457.1 hypothetical protein [Citrobacter sp. C1]MDM2753732.1 hypothetical protein [Citrobacter sp. Cpo221]RFU88820.1 hypothetical protein DZA29_25045 [Citrobacter gillenii]WFW14834.1 hypothetical protein NFJ59_08895 [Citrobacter freundii]
MTLFEECKELLKADFDVVEGDDLSMVMDIFHQYPWHSGNLIWSEMDFCDYELTHEMFNGSDLGNETVFVIADDADVPVFRTHLQLIVDNIYDVIAISPNLFIFNDKIMIKPLFPHDFIRFSLRK